MWEQPKLGDFFWAFVVVYVNYSISEFCSVLSNCLTKTVVDSRGELSFFLPFRQARGVLAAHNFRGSCRSWEALISVLLKGLFLLFLVWV